MIPVCRDIGGSVVERIILLYFPIDPTQVLQKIITRLFRALVGLEVPGVVEYCEMSWWNTKKGESMPPISHFPQNVVVSLLTQRIHLKDLSPRNSMTLLENLMI